MRAVPRGPRSFGVAQDVRPWGLSTLRRPFDGHFDKPFDRLRMTLRTALRALPRLLCGGRVCLPTGRL